MSMDTPARVAILGGGPIGIEAALYARYLGYDVAVWERDEIAANVLREGHLTQPVPFGELKSPLGIAALQAQDPDFEPPAFDEPVTGPSLGERLPAAAFAERSAEKPRGNWRLRTGSNAAKLPQIDHAPQRRSNDAFQILLEVTDEAERIESADVVIDATGIRNSPNWMGPGGIPVLGEKKLRPRIEYFVPDVLGTERANYAGRRVLVVGHAPAAARTILALSELRVESPATQITWATETASEAHSGPIPLLSEDCPASVSRLVQPVNELVASGSDWLAHRPETGIESIRWDESSEEFLVRFVGNDEDQRFDRIVANVGYAPNLALYEELQVVSHPRTGGPWGVGARLDGNGPLPLSSGASHRANWLITTEPHFYVLGAKSYGRDPRFTMSVGFSQIRDLFALLGERESLDLYATAERPDES